MHEPEDLTNKWWCRPDFRWQKPPYLLEGIQVMCQVTVRWCKECSHPVFTLCLIPQWATVTQMWWKPEQSKWSSSTPTRVSCTTTLCCMPRGCRPHCPKSCLCATLSTLGMSATLWNYSMSGRSVRVLITGTAREVILDGHRLLIQASYPIERMLRHISRLFQARPGHPRTSSRTTPVLGLGVLIMRAHKRRAYAFFSHIIWLS